MHLEPVLRDGEATSVRSPGPTVKNAPHSPQLAKSASRDDPVQAINNFFLKIGNGVEIWEREKNESVGNRSNCI